MNISKACRDYVTKIVSEVAGMKVLLVDQETAGMVSMVFTQTEIIEQEVFLVDRIDNARDSLTHMKCVAFLRPLSSNISLLCQELRNPKYGEYHCFFSNVLSATHIEELASSDDHELVKQVQEFFMDYYAVNSDLFSLNIPSCHALWYPSSQHHEIGQIVDRSVQGLMSVLLSLKKKPNIRCAQHSEACLRIAKKLSDKIRSENELFTFPRRDTPPLLLILDRRDDPVTPLLTQWTYQAMAHELLGIVNNRVSLANVPDVRDDLKEVTLSQTADPFFRDNMFANFGDLGQSTKQLVDDYQREHQSNENIQSIADMKRFVQNYRAFSQMSSNVSKHVAIMSEFSRQVAEFNLMDLSEIEQTLACNQNHSQAVKLIQSMMDRMGRGEVRPSDVVRLILLYALRYENSPSYSDTMAAFLRVMIDRSFPQRDIDLMHKLIVFAGTNVRGVDLFLNRSLFQRMTTKVKSGLKEVENVYTEHQPYLVDIIEQLAKGRLKEQQFPFIEGVPTKDRVQEVIVFIVGGATYEEACAVAELNRAGSLPPTTGSAASASTARQETPAVLLGGTPIHNSASFIEEIHKVDLPTRFR